MADLNSLDLTGRLTRDPELRQIPSGESVCNFAIACNGAREGEVVFVDVDVWGKQADACATYLGRGARVAVSGRLGVRDWTGDDGVQRRSVECNSARAYFLETKAESEARAHAQAATPTAGVPAAAGPETAGATPPPDDDDIPF